MGRLNLPREAHSSLYTLNFAPFHFDDAELQVGLLPYNDHEQLRQLRAEHGDTHVFRRHHADEIVTVPYVLDAPELGEHQETIRLNDNQNLPLVAELIRNALLRRFHRNGRQSRGYNPIRIFGPAREDLLRTALPPDLTCPEWLGVNIQYVMDVRVVHFDDDITFVGMALNLRSVNRIDLDCGALLARNLLLDDLYVGKRVPHADPRIAPRFQLVGRVRTVEDETLYLSDSRDLETVEAHEVFLDAGRRAFSELLLNVFKARAPQVKQAMERQQALLQAGPGRLSKLREVNERLSKPTEMVPGVSFHLCPFISKSTENGSPGYFPPLRTSPKPTYIYDALGHRTDDWHERGLNRNGPYSAETFTPARPRVCVICKSTDRGRIETFLVKLLNGVKLPGTNRQPFEKGLIRTYALESVDLEFFEAAGDSIHDYLRAAREAMKGARDRVWNLALIQTDERYRSRPHNDNPYLVTKAFFLGHGIASQDFRTQTVTAPDSQLAYVLNNMALASYAKLGGVPWLIQADQTIAHEFVIGLGSASIGEGRLGRRERVVGITTVFRGDGRYQVASLSRAVPIQDYQQTLLESLRETIDRVRLDLNWRPRTNVRLVFHSFKPLRDAEAEAVRQLMAELGDYNVTFAFLHIAENHPYMLFDENQPGVGLGGALKGVMGPTRGHFVRLTGDQVLLALKGAREVKRPQDGIPRPLLLKLHRNSTFKDTTYLARQVFNFSCHSWRTFFPSSLPVTILYSQLIAQLLGQLSTVRDYWSPESMYGQIGEKRWFL